MRHSRSTTLTIFLLLAGGPGCPVGGGDDVGDSGTSTGITFPGHNQDPGFTSADSGSDSGAGEGLRSCPPIEERPIVAVTEDVTTDALWACDQLYVLEEPISVTSAVLRIGAGTRVESLAGAGLSVERDGRLEARGTEEDPIVFGSTTGGPVDWTGIQLLGNARHASGVDVEVGSAKFGGTDDTHNCGTLEHIVVEQASSQDVPAVALRACGETTTVRGLAIRTSGRGLLLDGGTADLADVVVPVVAVSLSVTGEFRGTILSAEVR